MSARFDADLAEFRAQQAAGFPRPAVWRSTGWAPARLSADLLHDEQKEFECSYCGARAGDYCKVVAGVNRHKKAQFAHAPRARAHHAAKYGARP